MGEFQRDDCFGGPKGFLWISAENGENKEKSKKAVYTTFNKAGWQTVPQWNKSTRPIYVSGSCVGPSRWANSLYDEREKRKIPKCKTGLHSWVWWINLKIPTPVREAHWKEWRDYLGLALKNSWNTENKLLLEGWKLSRVGTMQRKNKNGQIKVGEVKEPGNLWSKPSSSWTFNKGIRRCCILKKSSLIQMFLNQNFS